MIELIEMLLANHKLHMFQMTQGDMSVRPKWSQCLKIATFIKWTQI